MNSGDIKNTLLLAMIFAIIGTGAGVAASKNGVYLGNYIPESHQVQARLHKIKDQASTFISNASIPEMPEITMPELPEIQFPEIKIPEFNMPEITFHKEMGAKIGAFFNTAGTGLKNTGQSITDGFDTLITWTQSIPSKLPRIKMPHMSISTLQSIEPQAGVELNANLVDSEKALEPHFAELTENKPALFEDRSGTQTGDKESDPLYPPEEESIEAEGVLVPKRATIISSSRDGKISKINFDDGDIFRQNDVLIEYECTDVKAELDAAQAEQDFSKKRNMQNEKLLRLDIISDIEHLGIKTEDLKAQAQARMVEARMEQCKIRAAYDGRVTKRLANEHEYTRSDRVLMEVGSLEDLEIEFLLPSKWLRWVNIGAPLSLTITETGQSYQAKIKRIHGEVDPVSQSIQLGAELEPYTTPLLPGMSGTIRLDMNALREAGIKGFLETPRISDAAIPSAD
jgi:membrane fusion protein, multidrug efflux system